jgi:hypothetical protein
MASAFQPRFVDLVRNYTTTQGTGNFVLGAAVNGYSSFAAALQAGDSFYYSALGVDKPAEREVGRGTLQANGTISRAAISGALTNFSSGTKTLSLIAAAEWFSAMQAASAAPANAATVAAASRSALAAASTAGLAMLLAESGREGVFQFDGSNLSAKVTADPRQGIYVAPVSDPTGASGAWVRKFDGPVKPEWFGIVADDPTAAAANSAAWSALVTTLIARALVIQTNYQGLGTVRFGNGRYDFAATIELTDGTVILEGTASGTPGAIGTVLRFASGTTGIRVQSYDTTDATGPAGPASAMGNGSVIRNLILQGAYPSSGVEAEAHGIQLRAKAVIDNVQCTDFQGDGLHIHAESGSPSIHGNANLTQVRSFVAEGCRNGVWAKGGDANASLFEGGSLDNNRQWGFKDESALGNLVQGVHFDSNGITGQGPPTVVTQNGNWYGVRIGQEDWCSVNPPSGTAADNQGWYYLGPGYVAGGQPAWSSGTAYRAGGSVTARELNASSMFFACYSEPGQGNPQVDSPSYIIGGGLAGRRNIGSSGSLSHVQGVLKSTSSIATDGSILASGTANRFGPNVSGLDNVVQLANGLTFNTVQFDSFQGGSPRTDGLLVSFRDAAGGLIVIGNPYVYIKSGNQLTGTPIVATFSTAGLELPAGEAFSINGQQVVGARQTGTAANATDLATAITLVNDLKAKLVAHGLVS